MIAVDWSQWADDIDYIAVVLLRVPVVGYGIATLIKRLLEVNVITLDQLHLMGHSLGAHVVGFAGKYVAGIGRITGWDPANEIYDLEGPAYHLYYTDANFVDVIHTDGGIFGYYDPLGDADFYPNGGTPPQPGCLPLLGDTCSHGRSYVYYQESILAPLAFMSWNCSSWLLYQLGFCYANNIAYMGAYVSSQAKGKYYLRTNAASPYGQS